MIVLRDSYDGGHYTTRVWCIFEVYTATMHNIPISVALPGASKAEFHKKLKDRHFSEIAASLTPLMPRRRKQPFQSDEDAIKSLIKETTGFPVVNETVKSALTRWLVSAFEECLQENAMSDVGRVIFKLVTGKDISGNDTKPFFLKDWIQAVRQHPDLADFLEVDGTQPDIAFDAMDLDHSGAVKAQEEDGRLERHPSCILRYPGTAVTGLATTTLWTTSSASTARA